MSTTNSGPSWPNAGGTFSRRADAHATLAEQRSARARLRAVVVAALVVLAVITTWLPAAEPVRRAALGSGWTAELTAFMADTKPVAGGDSRESTMRLWLADRHLFTVLIAALVDDDVDPLTWVDPQPRLACGIGSSFRVDVRSLEVGAQVPNGAFELDWFAQGCRPYGIAGPRLDGHLRFVVARENWGMSAARVPLDDARLDLNGHRRRLARIDVATPLIIDEVDGPLFDELSSRQWTGLPLPQGIVGVRQ